MGIRENILVAVKAKLGEIADAAVVREVKEPDVKWVKAMQGDSTHLLVVIDGAEPAVVAEKGTRKYLNHMEIQINGYSKDKDTPSETMNALLHEVKAKMEEDPVWGDNAYQTTRLRMEIIPNLERLHPGFRLHYEIKYKE